MKQRGSIEKGRWGSKCAIRLYHGPSHVGLALPWFSLYLIFSSAWLRPGWWGWSYVVGSLIVRAGPFVFTRWAPIRERGN